MTSSAVSAEVEVTEVNKDTTRQSVSRDFQSRASRAQARSGRLGPPASCLEGMGMRIHPIGGLVLVLAAASVPTAAQAVATTVDCSVATIVDALDAGFDEITVQGTCTEDVEIRRDDITIQGDPNDGPDTIVGQVFIAGAHRVTIQDLAISNSQFHGIAAVDGAAVTVARVTIDSVTGVGITGVNGAMMNLDHVTVQNSGEGTGIQLDLGSSGAIIDSTIQNHTATGISVFRHSTAILGGNTIQDNPEGVSVNEHSEAWLEENAISNNASGEAALIVIRGSTAQLRRNNTLASVGFAIVVREGASLHQRSADTVTGRVLIDTLSIAEFRNVTINGPVEIADHSLVRFRDQSATSNHVSVTGNTQVSRDSGLNFLKDAGEKRVLVVGNITCADEESSLSAPSSNVLINGNKSCTGYNNQNVQN